MSYTVPENIAEVRGQAWVTRRAKYGPAGHAGSYARGPMGDRAMRFLASMVADMTLSEGQVCQATGIDRVALRRLVDAVSQDAPGHTDLMISPEAIDTALDGVEVPDVVDPMAVLRELEAACDALAATRSQETYLRMVDIDKAAPALLALDIARSKARAMLSEALSPSLKEQEDQTP